MTWLMLFLARRGLSERLARHMAPIVIILAAIALCGAVGALWLRSHDAAVVRDHEAALDARAASAVDQAASERASNAAALSKQEERYHAAIDQADETAAPGAGAVALNCQRLRRAGIALPPACGPAGGDRSEADPDR